MARKNSLSFGQLAPLMDLLDSWTEYSDLSIDGIGHEEQCSNSDLFFIGSEAHLRAALDQKIQPALFVVDQRFWDKAQNLSAPKVRSKKALLSMAKASVFFSPEKTSGEIDLTAQIHPTAKIAKSVSIGAFCVVGENAVIGERTVLGSRVSISAGVELGSDCRMFDGVVIYANTKIADRVRIHSNSVIGADGFGYVQDIRNGKLFHEKIHHLGRVIIGSDVEIGASTTIDRGTFSDTKIGDRCIIDNQVQIGHNCQIGDGVIICGCTGLAGSGTVKENAIIAGMVGVANKIVIGEGAQVAAFSAVSSHIPAKAKWGGVPAMPWREYLRNQIFIGRLPKMFAEREMKNE
ncbi:MAG: UDP-3-O-(3-hydroxymyristoyl)glucosamine N-acyltransferase [Oligoflexia bacterium]|nr:UDP-3-O-(3-hydroxymyristoyl)glucosamine N-acyltransferase [Oligoflexia bacterium]